MAQTEMHQCSDNVVDIFTGLSLAESARRQFIRLSPELDGICMLYSNHSDRNKLYSMKLVCWALRENGDIEGLVPWFDGMRACSTIDDPNVGMWEGYYDPQTENIFFEPPTHKILELETAAEYFCQTENDLPLPIQEIADTIGTHAMFIDPVKEHLTLSEVISWRLNPRGGISAMLINQDRVTSTPVLPGDACLYPADTDPAFRYFFQHNVANQIKAREPEAMAAIALLLEH